MPPKKKEISVVDRRLKSGAIFAAGSRPIPLTEPKKWILREVNAQISDNRMWEMQADKGWVYAEERDIAVPVHEIGYRVMDGRLVKGERGHLVLMKMLQSDYAKIQHAKDEANKANTFGQAAIKSTILNAAAQEPGGADGAEFLNRAIHNITVTDSREAVSLEE